MLGLLNLGPVLAIGLKMLWVFSVFRFVRLPERKDRTNVGYFEPKNGLMTKIFGLGHFGLDLGYFGLVFGRRLIMPRLLTATFVRPRSGYTYVQGPFAGLKLD